jgi:hypothetical protein
MKFKIKMMFFVILIILSGVSVAFGATRFLIQAPGETYNPGSQKSGTPNPQTAGVPFYVTVYSADDITWQLVSTNGTANLSATQSTTFSPNPATLSLTHGSVTTCKQYVQVTFAQSVNGDVRIDIPTSGGILPTSITITSQQIQSFSFATISSPQTAGNNISYTITALRTGGGVVTSFNGTAAITASYTGLTYTVAVGTAQFVNGVATGNVVLYDATEGSQVVTLTCTSTTPSATGSSNTFAVNANTLDRLLIIGPGQQIDPGKNSGNGRINSSTTTSQQTAGTYFYVTVYACDAYWNTVTSASGTVTLSSSDPNFSATPVTTAFSSGKAYIRVTLGTVGTQTLTATHSGTATSNTDNVPVVAGALHHFSFYQNIATNVTAGSNVYLYIVAQDAYNNTVTSFNSAVTIQVLAGGSPIDANNWSLTPTSPTFSSGLIAGTARVRIFQRLVNVTVRVTYSSITGESNIFNVNPAAFNKILLIAPGETYDPGDTTNGGKFGTPSNQTVGNPFSIVVYATDQYGNQVTTINDTVRIESTDANALANGVTLPVRINLSGGTGTFNFIFQTSGVQSITVTDETTAVTPGTVNIQVSAATVHHFEIAGISSPQTAGNTTTMVIRALDAYNNLVTNYNGNVWVTSPDTDWSLPYETTIGLSGTNVELVGHRWHVTFTAGTGQKSVNISFYRSMTYTVKLFVSDNELDTPQSNIGHIGYSDPVLINHGSITKMQVIVPGMTARPGTLDGEDGTPMGQIVGQPFYVTVNACDAWWNIIRSGTGSTDTIQLTTNDNTNALAARIGQTLAQPPTTGFLTNGTTIMQVQYNQESSSFFITVSDSSRGGITQDSSPTINVFNIFTFIITGPGGATIGQQTAGVPFNIQIVAYSAFGVTATGFNNVTVKLGSNTNYSDSEYCIEPTTSATFVNGICNMSVTLYRARTTAVDGSGANIKVKFGNIERESNNFDVVSGPATSVLVLVDGMTHKPGLKHVGIPGYKGYEGSPKVVEAGQGFSLKVYYVDDNYNRVYSYPSPSYCKLTSTDAAATVNGISMASSNVYVTITAGAFETATGMILRTVPANGYQTITAEPGGSLPNNTSPPIYIRHTTVDHFGVLVPSSSQTAGVPFNITILALDAYQNVCDDRNGGIPFNETVNLAASTGANTMYPGQYTLSKGQVVASVQLFKAPETTARITATYSSISGTSNNIVTIPNEYKRLLIYQPVGMNRINGVFTGTSPVNFPMVEGAPFFPTGAVVNDSTHSPTGYDFIVYACDAYGNIVENLPDLAGHTVTVWSNDAYGVPVTPTTVNWVTGQQTVKLIFHTAKDGMYVAGSTTYGGVESYQTVTFTTLPGDPYGLQTLVPGLYVERGSGRLNGLIWNNGITGTASTQISGGYFPITVQACDIYGNPVISPTNYIRVYSNGPSPSVPRGGAEFFGYLGDYAPGCLTLTAQMIVGSSQYVNIFADDLNPGNLQRTLETVCIPNIWVAVGATLEYQLIVNGVPYGTGTNSTTAICYPDTFALTLNVIDSVSGYPVYGANNLFQFTPVLASNINIVANGNLAVSNGNVSNGRFTMNDQSYTRAERIRIKVSDPASVLADRYSCIIDFGANSLNAILTLTASPQNIRSGTVSNIIATVVDVGGNPVPNADVFFEFLPSVSTGTGDFIGVTTFTARTDSSGIAIAPFTGGYLNGICRIKGTYYGSPIQVTQTTVNVSLVDPSTGISNYPNPFRAGVENTNISFLLNEAVDVNMKIYDLFGGLVYEKTYTKEEIETIIQNSGNMVTLQWDGKNNRGKVVGNGGYICYITAGAEKYTRKIAVRK